LRQYDTLKTEVIFFFQLKKKKLLSWWLKKFFELVPGSWDVFMKASKKVW
jgi:hypothetical protein